MLGDPLAAEASSPLWVRWVVNVLFQLDCLVATIATGVRQKTISCWCGEVEEKRFGLGWYWGLVWLWWPVNWVARVCFGQACHCEQSVGPFIVREDDPDATV